MIDNVGTMHHEFAIFKTDLAAGALPVDAVGKVDEEKAGLLAEALYTKPARGKDDHRIRTRRAQASRACRRPRPQPTDR